VVCFVNTYSLDSDLSGGYRYSAFKQPGLVQLMRSSLRRAVSYRLQSQHIVPKEGRLYIKRNVSPDIFNKMVLNINTELLSFKL